MAHRLSTDEITALKPLLLMSEDTWTSGAELGKFGASAAKLGVLMCDATILPPRWVRHSKIFATAPRPLAEKGMINGRPAYRLTNNGTKFVNSLRAEIRMQAGVGAAPSPSLKITSELLPAIAAIRSLVMSDNNPAAQHLSEEELNSLYALLEVLENCPAG